MSSALQELHCEVHLGLMRPLFFARTTFSSTIEHCLATNNQSSNNNDNQAPFQ